MDKKENRSSGFSILFRILILLLATCVFGYAAYQMYGYVHENKESDDQRDALARKAVTILPVDSPPAEPDDGDSPVFPDDAPNQPVDLSKTVPIRVDFDVLHQENPDIVAWIYAPDTPINYPIVQGEDNQYYLHRMADGSYNAGGCIFMDFRNSSDLSDRNTLIYGHNITNQSMFGTLCGYKEQSYYDKHPVLWILVPGTAFRVDLIAGYVTSADSDSYTVFDSQEALDTHLEEILALSTFAPKSIPEDIQQIVTLSTCSYEYNAARYVVVGNLVPIPLSVSDPENRVSME